MSLGLIGKKLLKQFIDKSVKQKSGERLAKTAKDAADKRKQIAISRENEIKNNKNFDLEAYNKDANPIGNKDSYNKQAGITNVKKPIFYQNWNFDKSVANDFKTRLKQFEKDTKNFDDVEFRKYLKELINE
jgi:hypothetical protein